MKLFLNALIFISGVSVVSSSFAQNTLDNAGLTSASPASVAFSLRKLSTSYSGYAIKVRRATDNAEANVAFDASGNLTAASNLTYTPGVTVGISLGTTQTGTVSTDVARTGTITIRALKTGTITGNNGSLTITGTGTSFTTEVIAGDRLFNGSNNVFLGVVASVTNNTSLQLTNTTTVSITGVTFKTTLANVTGTGTNFTGQLSVGDRLFNTSNIYLGTVASIISTTSLRLNAVDALTATAVAYKGTTSAVSGTGTNFNSLTVGQVLVSNSITLGIIASISNATSLTLTTKAGAAVNAQAYKSATGTISFSSFYSGTSVFVNTLYDQSGNGRDAIQLKPANQARIVNAGILYTVNSRTSMEFSNALAAFLQTSTVASYLNNTLYTLNKVSAEATTTPTLQLPISTTGGDGPNNTIVHYGYRSAALFTVAQYGNDQDYSATPSTSLELHTAVKLSTAASQFYKNGISLGTVSSGAPSSLNNVGLLQIGFYTPTVSYYNGAISEVIVFAFALSNANVTLLNDNQLDYYDIASTYWTGAISTLWTNTGNWSTGVVPTISSPSIVLIPAGKPRYPVISTVSPANSITIEPGASLTITGTLQLAGSLNNDGTLTATGGTVEYIGAAPQVIGAGTFSTNTLLNLIVNNATNISLGTSITVSGNLKFTAGKFDLSSYSLTLGGTVTNTVTGGLRGNANSNLVVNGAVSRTLSFDQTIPGTTNLLSNLTINSGALVTTLGNSLVLNSNGTTTFTSGKLAIGSNSLTIKGAIVNTVNENIRGSASSNLIVDGTVSPVISMDQTTIGTTNRLNTFTINASGQTATLNRNINNLAILNIINGTLADGGRQITSTGTLNLSGGTFKLGSPTVATIWPSFATNNITLTGTVYYAAGVLQTVSGVPSYRNLTISATAGAIAAADINASGIVNVSAANPSATTGAFSTGTHTLNLGALATNTGQGDVTGTVKRTSILPDVEYTMGHENSSITFPNVGTIPTQISMKIAIGSTPSWKAGMVNRRYDFIQTGGTGTKALIKARYLDSELNGNIENKLVDFSFRSTGSIITEHGKSNFNTTENWIVLSNVNVAFFSSTFGNLELSFDETALTVLTWNGSTSTSWITATNWTPNGGPSTNTILIIPDAATTPNDPSLPAIEGNGSVTIESGGIVNADAGAQLSLNNSGLAWSNNGTFNAGTSTVTFTNANTTVNGTTNFHNLVIATDAALQMSSGSITRIGGTVINNGTWNAGLLENLIEYNGHNQTIIVPNGFTQAYHDLIISGTGTTAFPASNLNVRGDFTVNGAISVTANTLTMSGSHAQFIRAVSPLTLNNLTINNSSGNVILEQDVTVAGTLSFNSGKLSLGNNDLTLAGSVVNTVPNGLIGSSSGNLTINGAVSPVLSFDQSISGTTNVLNDLMINSTGQVPVLGSDLIISGHLNITAGELSIGANTLYLNGSLTNPGSGGLRGGSTSNLVLSGTAYNRNLSFDQSVPGTTNLLQNFTVNNTAQTTTLTNDLLIGGILSLNDGIINSIAPNRLTLASTATITGGNSVSFINGPLTRRTSSTGSYTMPIGKGNEYHPVSILPVSSAAGIYTSEFILGITPAGTMATGITGIGANKYWDISRTSGPDAQVELTFSGDNTWNVGSPSSHDLIFVTELNAGTWDLANGSLIPGNTGAGATPVRSMALSNFATFTFGYGPISFLPVTLISFSAEKIGNSVQLTWISADEVFLSHYELERSDNDRNFSALTNIPAAQSQELVTYQWLDRSPLNGKNYYRLKMLDITGTFKYSGIATINFELNSRITLFPNPLKGNQATLEMYGQPAGIYSIAILSNSGASVYQSKISHNGNNGSRTINLSNNLPAGIYYLVISGSGTNKNVIRLVIE